MTNRARQALKRKTETIAFRVSPEERERLEDAAIEAGMTLSGFISATLEPRLTKLRSRLAEMQKPAPPTKDEFKRLPPEVLNEISRIGNNLNQIAHGVNNGLPADTQRLVAKMHRLLMIINEHSLNPRRQPNRDSKPKSNDPETPQKRQAVPWGMPVHSGGPWSQDDQRQGYVDPYAQPRRRR